jgi:hypothetical protein
MQSAFAVLLSSVACPAPPYLSISYHKRHEFQKNVTELKMFALIFSTKLCKIFFPLRRRARYDQKCILSSCKVLVILVTFVGVLNFLNRFSIST